MSELEGLLSQKETLAEQLRRIAETCEGLENESNAAKVATLTEEQLKLSALKNELQDKVAALEKNLLDISRQINELSGSGVDKILNAIKSQRWFFFKNKPKVLFDRDTALLWNNPNYISYLKKNGSSYPLSEARTLARDLNLDGYSGWRIVNRVEFENIANSSSGFPFYVGSNRQIGGNSDRYRGVIIDYDDNGSISYRWTDGDYPGTWSDGVLLIYNKSLVPKDYRDNIARVNSIYSDKEKLLMTLNVFVTNGLEPIFSDATITELFRQIYIVKPEVQRQLTEIQQQIERLNEVELISPKLDWLALKTKFDLGANVSPVRYAASLKNLTEHLLEKFDDYTADKADVLAEMQKLSPPNELVPDTKAVRKELESFRDDALSLAEALMQTTSLKRLTELHAEVRPPFEVVVETLTEKVRAVLLKVEFFELQPDFVREACAALVLKFDFNSEFLKQLHLADRVAKNFLVELVRYVKAGHLQTKIGDTNAARIALAQLQNYREAVANLFRSSPANPQKSEILLQAEILQNNFAEVIGALDDEKERRRLSNLLRQLRNELEALP